MKDLKLTRPTQVESDAAYLAGKAKNVTVSGDNTGTPWVDDVINDQILGVNSAILAEAGFVPNGTDEKAGQSQIVDAVKKIIADNAHTNSERNAAGAHDDIYTRNFDSTVALRAQTDSSGDVIDLAQLKDKKVLWNGYYSPSDGGGNWGYVKVGDSTGLTDDGGSIFVIVNDAVNGVWVEANLKGFVCPEKFGAIGVFDHAPIFAKMLQKTVKIKADGYYYFDTPLSLVTGTEIKGFGTIEQTSSHPETGAFVSDSGDNNPQNNPTGIKIHGITMINKTGTFNEFTPFIALFGVTDIEIYRVNFIGFRGDGVYMGGKQGVARYNIRVKIHKCNFDGVNGQNRNGVSVVSGEEVEIYRNLFTRVSKSNMPGAIDIEYDKSDEVVKNIKIHHNIFKENTGSTVIQLNGNATTLTDQVKGIHIYKNRFINNSTMFQIQMSTAENALTANNMDIVIEGNEFDVDPNNNIYDFTYGIVGLTVKDNIHRKGKASYFGDSNSATQSVRHVKLIGNDFIGSGDGGGAFRIGSVYDMLIERNTIDNPDEGTATRAFWLRGEAAETVSSYLRLINNTFIKGASQTLITSISNHSTDGTTNEQYGNNVIGGTLGNQFPNRNSGTFAPTIGFETNGDLSVTYNGQVQEARYTLSSTDNLCTVHLMLQTTSLTYSTATGEFRIYGLPYVAATTTDTGLPINLGVAFAGVGSTNIAGASVSISQGTDYLRLLIPAATLAGYTAANTSNIPSGQNVAIRCTIAYAV